jgi:hypothetical protein
VGDIPGRLFISVPHAEELDQAPATLRSRNADFRPQTQIATRSIAICFGGAGLEKRVCKFLADMRDQRAIR